MDAAAGLVLHHSQRRAAHLWAWGQGGVRGGQACGTLATIAAAAWRAESDAGQLSLSSCMHTRLGQLDRPPRKVAISPREQEGGDGVAVLPKADPALRRAAGATVK